MAVPRTKLFRVAKQPLLVGVFVAMSFAFPLVESNAAEPDEAGQAAVLAELRQYWTVQQDDIQTAKITANMFLGPFEPGAFSREKMEAWLDQVENGLQTRPSLARLQEHTEKLPIPKYRRIWEELNVVQAGLRLRNTRSAAGKINFDSAFDGDTDVQYMNGQPGGLRGQVNIYRGRSLMGMNEIGDLRLEISPEELPFTVVSYSDAEVRLSGADELSMTVDRKTGFVRRLAVAGTLEVRQFLPGTFPGGISFPTVRAKVTYHDSHVNLLTLFHVIHADFNSSVDDTMFKVPIPSNTTVVDERASADPNAWRTSIPGSDAIAVADDKATYAPSRRVPIEKPVSRVRWALTVGSAIIPVFGLLVLGVWLLRLRGR